MTDDLKDALDAAWSEWVRHSDHAAEIARLREERDRFEAALGRACQVGGTTYLVERAEKAEAERDAALAQVAMTVFCTDCENTTTRTDDDRCGACGSGRIMAGKAPSEALSRRDAQMRAEGRKEGLREAAALCDDTAQEALEESGAESRTIWTWFRGQRDAILAAAEREASP